MKFVVEARAAFKEYGNIVAVAGIDFKVRRKECFGFLGPNGAGKTTTINLISCYCMLTGGSLRVFGMDVASEGRRIKALIGVVPQETNLDPDITVLENLVVYARYFDISRRRSREKALELLKFLQLDEKRDELIPSLSGGMKRRLLIARALINDPRLLILDEPTTGLDPQARHLIWEKLRGLKKSGVTMVLTTHYMEEAEQLCDRIVIMEEGRIAAEGSPRDLVDRHVGREVIEVRATEGEGRRILRTIKGMDFTLERSGDTMYLFSRNGTRILKRMMPVLKSEFLHRHANLEDVFLKLTGRELRE